MVIVEQDRKRLVALAVAGSLALAASPLVSAATVPVSNGGSLYLSETTIGTGTNPFGNISAIAVPGNYTYSDSWSSAQTSVVSTTSSGFYDDFVFTVAAGQLDSVTSSVSLGQMLGISGMQVRLYDYNANGQVAPLLTTPVAGSAFDAWSSTVAFPGGARTVDVLPTTTLAPGTYVIEVRGTVTGSNGGNYTGSLNVTPVPLPSSLPILLSGLGLLSAYVWRLSGAPSWTSDRLR
jgi:hypothetical protein